MKANQKPKLSENDEGALTAAALFGVMLLFVIGFALVNPVINSADNVTQNPNADATTIALAGLAGLIFLAILLLGAWKHMEG